MEKVGINLTILYEKQMEADIETLWSGLMLRLCSRHRINARNGRPTDYRIGD
jgi:hypothetical protein